MSARWWTLGVWALAAAGALFWALKIFVVPPMAPPQTQLAEPGAGLRGDLTRLLGVDPPPPEVAVVAEAAPDARFALIGVVSPRAQQAAREGVALIAVDGKPARAYRVGAVVDGENVLKSVSTRGATLGPREGASLIALNLAPSAPAATGALPALPIDGAPPRAVRPGLAPPVMPPVMPTVMPTVVPPRAPQGAGPAAPQFTPQYRPPMQPAGPSLREVPANPGLAGQPMPMRPGGPVPAALE